MSPDSTSLRVIRRLAEFMTRVSITNAPVEWRDLSFRQIKAAVESEVLDFSPNVSDLACFPYPRLFVYVWTVLHLEDESRSFAALQSQWFKWIALDEVAQIESSVSIKYDLQAFLTPHRQIFVDGLIKDIIKLDMQNVAAIIVTSLLDSETRKSLLGRPKPQSQDLLDVLQELLNSLPLHDVRPRILLATYQISKRTGLYPKTLQLSGVEALQQSENRGSFGDIWKGNFSGTLVAIKVMRHSDAERSVLLKTFIGEAILWRELSHPNVLSFHGIHLWSKDGRICLVSPWMENGNLVSYLKDHSDADRLSLALDVARGLEYLHSFDPPIIHGDLKGNNILITSNLRACVADFGLGKFIQTDALCQFTPSTTLPGALMWCAPELVTEDRPTITLASDVYALGCVFYEIFAGKVRFAHLTNFLHLVTAISSGTIPERPEGIDDNIWGIILQCWSLNPASRPTTQRILETLLAIREHHDGRKSPPSRPVLRPIMCDAAHSSANLTETTTTSLSTVASEHLFDYDAMSMTSSTLSVDYITQGDTIVALMGPVGTGKSSFINHAMGRTITAVSHGMASGTNKIQAFTCSYPDDSGRRIVLVDTPGFDDSEKSDYEILVALSQWLVQTYKRQNILTGVLQLHRISDTRMRATSLRNLKMLKELCGDNALANVIHVTTCWDRVTEEVGARREQQLKSEFWNAYIQNGSRIARFHSDFDSAWQILGLLDVTTPRPLLLQKEMVDQKKKLRQTSAFQSLVDWWKHQVARRVRKFFS
ncbi:kinase-like domain-containing protein [Mycena floridula]|nr:kinase-like domain-containing protein [Mycena floridula]